jgi:hypothetical protein
MKTKKTCPQKRWYLTAGDAEHDRAQMAAAAKRRGDKSHVRLCVYPCKDCGLYHVGHVRPSYGRPVSEPKPATASAPKVPAHGELRRKLARIDKQYDRMCDFHRRRRCAAIGELVAGDLRWLQKQAELERERAAALADLKDSIAIAHRMAEPVLAGLEQTVPRGGRCSCNGNNLRQSSRL